MIFMRVLLVSCLISPIKLFADVTSSCESTLPSGYTRSQLSDICYTQHDNEFLQWQGHWDNNANKYFTKLSSWELSLTAINSQPDWRLPTIKELNLLTTKALVDSSNLAPDAFTVNWMLQKWFLRDNIGTSLMLATDAYLLSSTYQADSGSGTSKVMAVNVATGLIEALNFSDFDSKSVYIVKVKQSEPSWLTITTKFDERLNFCLNHQGSLSSQVTVETCDGSNQQKWIFESNTGFIRSYSGGCLQVNTFDNYEPATYETCSNYSAEVSPANSDRWQSLVNGSGFNFRSQSDADHFFYVGSGVGSTSLGDILIWDYSSISHDDQNTWFY